MEIIVRLIDCDTIVKESVSPNSDGSYTIFLNARHTAEQQHMSCIHALSHIMDGDFDKYNSDKVEAKAHCIR